MCSLSCCSTLFTLIAVIVSITVVSASTSPLDIDNRIVGGNKVQRGDFPYMVSLVRREDSLHMCGGALINSKYFLTSASCLIQSHATFYKEEQLIAYIGAWKLAEDATASDLDEIKRHPDYVYRQTHHDLSLIRLTEAIVFNRFVKPIKLPVEDFQDKNGVALTVIGFGSDIRLVS